VTGSRNACGRAAAGYGESVDDEGYDTAEEAARGDIPERYARILRIDYSPDRTRAVALLATNEPPAIEYYEVHCDRGMAAGSQTAATRTDRTGSGLGLREEGRGSLRKGGGGLR
jgi:hypothetical protein